MLWFCERDDESLKLETRYDNDTSECVGSFVIRMAASTLSGLPMATSMVHGSRRSSETSNISTGLATVGP